MPQVSSGRSSTRPPSNAVGTAVSPVFGLVDDGHESSKRYLSRRRRPGAWPGPFSGSPRRATIAVKEFEMTSLDDKPRRSVGDDLRDRPKRRLGRSTPRDEATIAEAAIEEQQEDVRNPPRRRRLLLGLLVLATTATGAAWASYPAVGSLTYSTMIAVESRIHGFSTRHANVDGLRMAYYEGGPEDAPSIVMLHGYSADRDVWLRFASHLDEDFHIVIPDLAGHGDTPFVEGADYSAVAQADRVAALLDDLGIDTAHVIGNSMGGLIAALFAHQHPERALSIGLSDPVGVTAPQPSEMDRMLARGQNPFLISDPARFDDFYAMTMARPPYVPGFVKDAMAEEYVDRRPELREIFEGLDHIGLLDGRLGEITTPAYVVWGEADRLVDPSAAKVWAGGLPNATLVTYSGIGHMPMLEIPERSADDYREFLASVPSNDGR